MSKISDSIYRLIKEEKFADPFSDDFNFERVALEFGSSSNKEEITLLEFLLICNNIFKEIKKNVFSLYDKINLGKNDLNEYLFIAINKQLLYTAPLIFEQANNRSSFEVEKTSFSKFTNSYGKEINAEFAIEIGSDILSVLLNFATQWTVNKTKYNTVKKKQTKSNDKIFHSLWVYANIFYNIKDCAYDIVKFENGEVIIKEKTIKIVNGLQQIKFLNNAGVIRANSNIQEFYLPLIQLYKNSSENLNSKTTFKSIGNILKPIKGKLDSTIKARADSSLYIFYPHFINEKLDYFKGLTLSDLLQLLVLIEDCVGEFYRQTSELNAEKRNKDVPIKFNENELVKFLSDSTGYENLAIKTFVNSLVSENNKPYFWIEPFIRINGFLLFSLSAIISPNHSLYFDKWTTMSGYTLEQKELKFTKFILYELTKSKQTSFEFNSIDITKIVENSEAFNNNLVFETSSFYILLEIKVFNFPIESQEIDFALHLLGKASLKQKTKASILNEKLGNKKEIIKIIVTNYQNFSGLQVNDISIADFTLLKNYLFVGQFKRVSVTFSRGKPVFNSGSAIYYYKNENEFNNNLRDFFYKPLPVTYILNKLRLVEQVITPESVYPKFIIDIVDHVTDEELMDSRLENLNEFLNYEYFGNPTKEVITSILDQSIIFSLSEIFNNISVRSYESFNERNELYFSISKTKLNGFAHLSLFILKAFEQLQGKRIIKTKRFKSIDFKAEEAFELLRRENRLFSGAKQLSDFVIEEGIFTVLEEKKLVSFAIDFFSWLTPKSFDNDILQTTFIPLGLLHAFSGRHETNSYFYSAASNIIDALNYIHKFQEARDFCEVLLQLSINNDKHSQGWNILFKCYTNQKSLFDASINGSIFLSSLSLMPEVPEDLAVDALYGALKFFRNFEFTEYAKFVYESLKNFELDEYDRQKITLSYFNSIFQGEIQHNINVLDEVLDYVEKNIKKIIDFGEHGVVPWLSFFYNVNRYLLEQKKLYKNDIEKYIQIFESKIDKKSINSIKTKIFGNIDNPKEYFILAITNTYETRSISDFIYEIQLISHVASYLIQFSIENQDLDGILLAGLVLNDQRLTYKNISVVPGSIVPISKPTNLEFKNKLEHYKQHLLSKIKLEQNQVFLWLFENKNKVFYLSIDSSHKIVCNKLNKWNLKKMRLILNKIGNFYFNAKKDEFGISKCEFSNPRGEFDYNNIVQQEDLDNLSEALLFTNISLPITVEEIFISTSIDMACVPHNLISLNKSLIASKKPICNVLSIEHFIENSEVIRLGKNYTVSAWIPKEDNQFVVEMGYEILKDTLHGHNAFIHTATYPTFAITTDINVFLAHGVTDESGFKAIYTNPEEKKAIAYPFDVFGSGKVAILFICNSGSSKEEKYSNSITSFTSTLLNYGYKAVIAPFWPFDVSMSKIWLEEFFLALQQGYSVNESVFLSNKKLAMYDEATSSLYLAPAGSLAMHLYGNPNIYVNSV